MLQILLEKFRVILLLILVFDTFDLVFKFFLNNVALVMLFYQLVVVIPHVNHIVDGCL